jgi:hypothetical protein
MISIMKSQLHSSLLPLLAVFAFTLSCSFMFYACRKNNPVAPPPPDHKQQDTTSHDFVWFIDTLGAPPSYPNDICCISDTNVWAVGLFYVKDSTGKINQNISANAAHWDGYKWTLVRIMPLFNGDTLFSEIHTVWATADNDIWVDASRFNGEKWIAYDANPVARGQPTCICSDNYYSYIVGFSGTLIGMPKSASATQFEWLGEDIYPNYTGIWCCKDTALVSVADPDRLSGKRGYVLRLEKGKIIGRENVGLYENIAIWGMNGIWYTGGTECLYRKNGVTWKQLFQPSREIHGIRGTALNNVFFYLNGGTVLHYNGSTFKEIFPPIPSGNFWASKISVSGKAVFFAGNDGGQPLFIRGYRIGN